MKRKKPALLMLAIALAFVAVWRYEYQRGFHAGYGAGGKDEFLRWEQEPTRMDEEWDGIVTGNRDMRGDGGQITLKEPSGRNLFRHFPEP